MRYFGIRVSSNVPLHPDFVSDSEPDITLRCVETESAPLQGNDFEISYDLPREGWLEVTHNSVTLRPRCTLDEGRAAELLGGPGFGLSAFLRGYAVLHGSSVVANGRMISFVGNSGAGKSTMAAQAVRAGAAFCSDGMTLIDLQTGQCRGGPPRWKLRADSLSALGEGAQNHNHVWPGSAKFLLKSPSPAVGAIGTILLLETGDDPRIEWLTPAEGALQLMVHCYSVRALLPKHTQLVFERMTRLARDVRIGRFFRPRKWECLPRLGEWVLHATSG